MNAQFLSMSKSLSYLYIKKTINGLLYHFTEIHALKASLNDIPKLKIIFLKS